MAFGSYHGARFRMLSMTHGDVSFKKIPARKEETSCKTDCSDLDHVRFGIPATCRPLARRNGDLQFPGISLVPIQMPGK